MSDPVEIFVFKPENIQGKVMHPTGKCFDDALEFLTAVARDDSRQQAALRFKLVHGICFIAEHRCSHAWVEDELMNAVWTKVLVDEKPGYVRVNRAQFYKRATVEETTKYTVKEAWEKNRETEHYGPWEAKYKLLCGRKATPPPEEKS